MSENKTINSFHLWRQSGCSLKLIFTVFFSLQLKAYVRASKQGWWMWPCGWGPALTIPEVTRPQAGIQYPGLSLRNCLNKKTNSPGSIKVCYLTLQNDQVRFLLRRHSITDGNLNVFSVLLKYYTRWQAYKQEYCVILSTRNKHCTVAFLLVGAVRIQTPMNTHCDKTLRIFKLYTQVTCLYSLLLLIKSSFYKNLTQWCDYL